MLLFSSRQPNWYTYSQNVILTHGFVYPVTVTTSVKGY